MPRTNYTWLTLRAGLRDLLLQENHTPYDLLSQLYSPTTQTPQMISLLGARTKTLLMNKLRFGPNVPSNVGEVQLRIDCDGFKDNSPVLFADCELHNAPIILRAQNENMSPSVTRRPLIWHRGISQALDPVTLAHLVYSKLLAPFSTVVCFIAEDFGGLGAVAGILALWLISFDNTPSDLPMVTYPTISVLTPCKNPIEFDEQQATNNFMLLVKVEIEKKIAIMSGSKGKLSKADLDGYLAAQFGRIRVIGHPTFESNSRSWKAVKSRILSESHDLHIKRKQALVAFSATHFKSFFHLACDHFSTDLASSFSFVKASRSANPLPVEFLLHMRTFMKQVTTLQVLNFAVPMIASALAFEGYPARMHGFHPELVFKQLFQHLCQKIDPFQPFESQDGTFTSQFTNAVKVAFSTYVLKIVQEGRDDIAVHQSALERFKEVWKTMYSNVTCFSCLARSPENTLSCHHALCNPCVREHGLAAITEPWTYWMDSCLLCGDPNYIKFTLKPDTAGVRVLIIDGGGVKGIIPLSFLTGLEDEVKLPMSIQEHFDFAVGSSSGALDVLALFVKRWHVKECIKRFENLSLLAFRRRSCFGFGIPSFGILRPFLELCLSIMADSRYSSSGITKALVAAFGDTGNLFESACGGTKIGVVATTEDSSTCVFSNYNGPQKRLLGRGYTVVRPDDRNQEIMTWQAGRASSAAPSYFKSFLGYQDGGLGGHNNPINLALWEQDALWEREKKQPDIVLSLGTGFRREPADDEVTQKNISFFRSRCIPRLFRSFLKSLDGETKWQEVQNTLTPGLRNRYHRLNIEFFGDEPQLDDVQVMPNLKKQVALQASSNDDLKKCSDNLLASLFYIELLDLPLFDGTAYNCQVQILCRLGPSHQALRVLTQRLRDSDAHFYLDFGQKLPCTTEDSQDAINNGSPFSQIVNFRVSSLESILDIKIDGIIKRARSISNCPYVINTLIKDSRLHCTFGSRLGRKRLSSNIDQPERKRARFEHWTKGELG